MAENVSNNYTTTLNGAINSSVTSLVVTSATGAPSANFRILVDSEYMLVTAVSGATFTVTRGIEGSTATSHSNGATLSHILTAGGLAQYVSDHAASPNVISDTYANLPAAGTSGRLFFPTDGIAIGRDTGTTWKWWMGGVPITPPDNSAFSWVNQGSATATQTGTTIYMNAPTASSDQARMRVKSLPASTNYTITLGFIPVVTTDGSTASRAGIVLRDSATGKYIAFVVQGNSTTSGYSLDGYKYTAINNFSASYFTSPVGYYINAKQYVYFRIKDDGTNRRFYWSFDGVNFQDYFDVGRTDFITPDQCGFFVSSDTSNAWQAYITVFHWSESTP